jgi:hypothetical protein
MRGTWISWEKTTQQEKRFSQIPKNSIYVFSIF